MPISNRGLLSAIYLPDIVIITTLGLLTDQVALMVERAESQIGGEIETESDVEMKAIIEDLESKFTRMESDLKVLLRSDTTEAQLKKINEMFEEFKTNTITKDEFVAGIEDKADKEEIANIVSYHKIVILEDFNKTAILDPTRRV